MKKISMAVMLAGLLAIPAFAAEKEVTITGEGKCAKCSLHEADKCQNVIETKDGDKTVTYWLAPNKVSKDFHENLCHAPEKVTATGTVKEEKGKKILTVTKIEAAK